MLVSLQAHVLAHVVRLAELLHSLAVGGTVRLLYLRQCGLLLGNSIVITEQLFGFLGLHSAVQLLLGFRKHSVLLGCHYGVASFISVRPSGQRCASVHLVSGISLGYLCRGHALRLCCRGVKLVKVNLVDLTLWAVDDARDKQGTLARGVCVVTTVVHDGNGGR